MKVVFVTLALDAMPFVTFHYPEFRKLDFEWEWKIAEGVAAPVADTSWVAPVAPRLSRDGTTPYLDALADLDRRVQVIRKALWPGKTNMLNALLKTIHDPCLLVEIDSDEVWGAGQIRTLRQLFIDHPEKNSGRFFCNYFVGSGIRITSRGTYGNMDYEWNRAWRVSPGVRFKTHEPPVLENFPERFFTREETEKYGLVFDHFAYATEAQVRFKEEFYGSSNNLNGAKYSGAVEKWRRLQANTKWPVKELAEFMPWVGPGVTADRI